MHSKMIYASILVIAVILAFAFIPGVKNATNVIADSPKDQGIQFSTLRWNDVLQEAKKHNKVIFLDAYASWCGPCKLLKKKTFIDQDAGEFFNRNFINAAIDMEKGEGPDLAAKYGVKAYPTLIITDADGNIVTYTTGYIKPRQLIEFGKYGLSLSKK